MLNDFARLAPGRSPKGKKRVQGILRKNMSLHSAFAQDRFLKLRRTEMSQLFQNRKIDNQIADRNSNTRFIETAAAKRSYEFPTISQPFDVDLPCAPAEKFVIE